MDKTLVLAGLRPKRVRFRIDETTLEQTTWNAKGVPKITAKHFASGGEAERAFDKAVRTKLRADYVHIAAPRTHGDVVFEAFAPGGGGGAVLDMALDGTRIATATITSERMFGAKVEIVDVASGARHVVVEEPGGNTQCFLHAVLFDRAGTGLFCLLNNTLFHVDISTGKRRAIAQGDSLAFNPHVLRPSFDRERRRLVVFDRDATVRVLDEHGASLLDVSTKSTTTECRAAAISPSGRLLALYITSHLKDDVKHATNEIQLWDIEAGVRWETVEVSQRVRRIGLAPGDDELLVTWDYMDGPVALAIPSGEERWRITDPEDPSKLGHALSWAYSPDGSRLAIGAYHELRVYESQRHMCIDLPAHVLAGCRGVECVTVSGDGSRIAYVVAGTAVIRAFQL